MTVSPSPRYLSDLDVFRLPWPRPSSPAITARDVRMNEAVAPFAATADPQRRRMVTQWIRSYLDPLRNLAPNWDSYGAMPIASRVFDAAEQLSTELLVVLEGQPWPTFVPRPDGGIAIEWDRPHAELVIELPATSEPLRDATVSFAEFDTQQAWDERLDSAGSLILDALDRMAV